MNKVILIGNLTRDPELSETGSGVSVCRFSIAVNRSYTNGDGERETDFFNCVAWRGLGETIAKYFTKGKKIGICGSIETRQYEGNDHIKRNATEIVVKDIEFLSPKEERDDARNASRGNSRGNHYEGFDDDGDIPF